MKYKPKKYWNERGKSFLKGLYLTWISIPFTPLAKVHIKARTHDPYNATPTEERPYNIRIERDITIGDYVWIWDNVFINAGVKIGDNSIVGANAVVVHDVPPNTIVGGVPARILKTKYGENKENE